MDSQGTITAAVLVDNGEIYLSTEPDELPTENTGRLRLCGYLTYCPSDPNPWNFSAPDKPSAFVVGAAMAAFVLHVTKTISSAKPGPGVKFLDLTKVN